MGFYTFSVQVSPADGNLLPGNWTFELRTLPMFARCQPDGPLVACEGECGSQHEHSAVFSTDSTWILIEKPTHKPAVLHPGAAK